MLILLLFPAIAWIADEKGCLAASACNRIISEYSRDPRRFQRLGYIQWGLSAGVGQHIELMRDFLIFGPSKFVLIYVAGSKVTCFN